MQYKKDLKRFVDLIHKFTGIKKRGLSKYLETSSVKNFIESPLIVHMTDTQFQKLSEIKEIWNLFNNLKNTEDAYRMDSPSKAKEYFKNYVGDFQGIERFICAFLDNNLRILSTKIISIGTVGEAAVYPREIIKEAILQDAKSVIVAHNHPGGKLVASKADIATTIKIEKALNTVDVSCQDHIIVADNKAVSLREEGIF